MQQYSGSEEFNEPSRRGRTGAGVGGDKGAGGGPSSNKSCSLLAFRYLIAMCSISPA